MPGAGFAKLRPVGGQSVVSGPEPPIVPNSADVHSTTQSLHWCNALEFGDHDTVASRKEAYDFRILHSVHVLTQKGEKTNNVRAKDVQRQRRIDTSSI